MKFDKEHISYVYEHINHFKPLNCICKSANKSRYLSIESYKVPSLIESVEREMMSSFERSIPNSGPNKIHYYETSWKMRYMGLGMYEEGVYLGHIILGPYLNKYLAKSDIHNIIEEQQVEEADGKEVIECCNHLPILDIDDEKIISNIVYTLLQVGDMKVKEVQYCKTNDEQKDSYSVIKRYQSNRIIFAEQYYGERRLLHYIKQGNEKKALHSLQKIDAYFPEEMPCDSLRDFKNVVLSINTLMRKSVESQNVDLYILYRTAVGFRAQIEQCSNINEIRVLIDDMAKTYCTLVNQAINIGYSPIIVKVSQYIKFNMEKELTLQSIAKEVYIHPNYLSKKFKEETGIAVFEYINKVRIEEAQYLLKNTYLSIEEIAYTVGYNDKKYFAKVFKKNTQQTPSEYRNT